MATHVAHAHIGDQKQQAMAAAPVDVAMTDVENRDVPEHKPAASTKQAVDLTKGARPILGDISNTSAPAKPEKAADVAAPALPTQPAQPAVPEAKSKDSQSKASDSGSTTNDPNLEYAADIYHNLLESEARFMVSPQYMQKQPHLSWHMRRILVDWLSEVAQELKLQSDTLFLAVNYIDRFLQLKLVVTDDLQLLGITCMWMAAKYEEVYCPTVQQCADMTAGTYSWQQLVHMEMDVLDVLKFHLTAPTAKLFQRYFAQFAPVQSNDMYFLASYLLELSLLNEQFLAYKPSVMAASALHLSLMLLQCPLWSEDLELATSYHPAQFKMCTMELAAAHMVAAQQETAVYQKWCSTAVSEVATLPGLRTVAPIETAAHLRY